MRFLVTVDDHDISVALAEPDGAATEAEVDGVTTPLDWRALTVAPRSLASGTAAASHYSLLLGATSYDVYTRRIESDDAGEGAQSYEITIGAHAYTVTLRDERTQALGRLAGGAHHSGDAAIKAPMPGLVANVLAQEGQMVERGQAIVVLEAMKMENDLTTPRAGLVKNVRVTKGQTVNQNDILAVIGDADADEASAADAEDETAV